MDTWKKICFGIGAFAMFALAPPDARANLTLQTGLVGGSGDVSNVQFNPCGLGSSVGTTILGCLNDANSTLVSFTSSSSLEIQGGGQAQIVGSAGAFSDVEIKLVDTSLGFTKLQFNLDMAGDGTATFVGVDQFGTSFDFGAFAVSGNGQNFFTMLAEDDQVAMSFTITSDTPINNISELQQVRIGTAIAGVCPNGAPNFPLCTFQEVETPEPMSMAMLGVGLLGLGLARMRRRTTA